MDRMPPEDGSDESLMDKLARLSAENLQKRQQTQNDFGNAMNAKVKESLTPDLYGPKLPSLAEHPAVNAYMDENIMPLVTLGALSGNGGVKGAGKAAGEVFEQTKLDPKVNFFDQIRQKAIDKGRNLGKSGSEKAIQAVKSFETPPVAEPYNPETLAKMGDSINGNYGTFSEDAMNRAIQKRDNYERFMKLRGVKGVTNE